MQHDAAPAGRAVGEAEPPTVRAEAAPLAVWMQAVYDEHARELWAVFYAQCCDPDLARDALQEVFLRLHSQDREALRDVKAWLVRVGRNWLRDVARRKRHAARPAEYLDDFAGDPTDPLDRMEAAETQSRVRACLADLREDDREALVLRYALGWSSARMSGVLGISAAAIDMRLSRARRRLAELLRDDGFPIPNNL